MRSLYTVGADSAYQPQFEIDEEDTAEMQPLVSSSLETCRRLNLQRRQTGQTVKSGC